MTAKPELINASCGNMFILNKGCNMPHEFIDLIGQRFGKLKVIEKVIPKDKGSRGVRWKCKCDCGNERIAYGGHLRHKSIRSCGCSREVNIEKTGARILQDLTKRKCIKRNRKYELSLQQYHRLITQNCSYCGSEPSQILRRSKSKKIQIIHNGIDRIDSEKGYNQKNCVTCCKWCNQSKSSLSLKDWKRHLLKIMHHMEIK